MPTIQLQDIDLESSVQVRAKIDPDTVADYAAHIAAKKPPLPPIVVFGPDRRGKYYLSEGWHRLEAHRKAGRNTIAATIKDGGWKEALEHALGSNTTHGLRRTNADKRRCVELALKHWDGWSDQVIADKCSVHVNTVRAIRSDNQPPQIVGVDENPTPQPQGFTQSQPLPEQPAPLSRKVIGKDGKVRSVPPPPTRPPQPTAPPKAQQPALPTDPNGKPIPPTCLNIWNRRQEVQDLMTAVSEVRSTLKHAQDDRDPLWNGTGDQGSSTVNFSSALAHLNQAYTEIKAALPHCVCPMCQGLGCRNCSGLGLISEFRLRNIIPKEYRP